jgi:type I restriction enzyme M protein
MWVQHFITHLSNNGLAGFVMANGSMSVSGKEGDIRSAIIEDDLIDCMVALPERLFYTTGIPACLWFISKNKSNRKGKTLFIDARKIFYKVDRAHNSLSNEQIKDIAKVYHDFKAGKNVEDIKGFCSVVDVNTIREYGYVLTPGRYVGVEKVKEEQEPFNEKMERLSLELHDQFAKSKELEEIIRVNLEELGYGV